MTTSLHCKGEALPGDSALSGGLSLSASPLPAPPAGEPASESRGDAARCIAPTNATWRGAR